MSDVLHHDSLLSFNVRPMDRPWTWLEAGWDDMRRAPHASLAYGVGVTALSWAVTGGLFAFDLGWLLAPMLFGFVLIAPMLAVGVCEISRQLDQGLQPSLVGSFAAVRRNTSQLGLMGALLLLIHLAWVQCAVTLFALFFGESEASVHAVADVMFFSDKSVPFLIIGGIVGAVFAATTFAVTAVSIPMMTHRDVSLVQAVATSVKVCRANWPAMALWAGLIAAFTAVGLATYYVGLAVLSPLVGHAAWRAYRDLVRDDPSF